MYMYVYKSESMYVCGVYVFVYKRSGGGGGGVEDGAGVNKMWLTLSTIIGIFQRSVKCSSGHALEQSNNQHLNTL